MFSKIFHYNHPNKQVVVISPTIVVFTVFFILGLYFLWYIQEILTVLLLAFIIAVALNPVAKFLQRKLRIAPIFAIVLTYLMLITVILILIGLLIPPLVRQLVEVMVLLDVNLPYITDALKDFKLTFAEVSSLASSVGTSVNALMGIIASTFSSIFTTFTLFVISFYMLLERRHLHKKISWWTLNPDHHKRFKKCLDSVEDQLGGWVRAEVSLMTTIGLITYAGLLIFQIPYALPLAVLAAVLEILPNLGPTISAIPAIFLAYVTHGWIVALAILIMYVLIQQVENNILVPKVMSHRVHINPLIVIVLILIGLEMGGVLGAVLAIPIYIIIRTVYHYYFKDMMRAVE